MITIADNVRPTIGQRNVPGQFIIQTALGGYQSINDLTRPGGRLRE